MLREEFRHRTAGRDFQLVIGIAEGQSEAQGQAPPDGGFAGAHQPHQHYARSAAGLRAKGGLFAVRGRFAAAPRRPRVCLQLAVARHDGQR